nr:deoxyribodipyrimidine photolyase [Salmonella enterica subsp. enterica serovar Typhimurium]
MPTHLVWFRRDLRLQDNLAAAACRDASARVLALYISTPQWQAHDMAPRQAAFISAQLALQTALAEKGIPLLFHEVAFNASIETVKNVCRQHDVSHFYNYQYEFNERQRDRAVEKLPSVICEGFDDSVILAPGAMTGNHEMYKVFTPFKNAWLRLKEDIPPCVPAPKIRVSGLSTPLTPVSLNYPQQEFDALFPVEENAVIAQLRQFCAQADEYALRRDFPAVDGTSRLASLATGGLSPRQCLHRLLAQPQALDGGPGSVWLNELIWEFYRHLMTWYPALCKHQPFRWTKRVAWQENPHYFQAWQGETGYPIVDAAMRQLNATGMHNRLRMITASFLVKDLLIWRLGERYFMSQLIDGDLAANGGWQWAASTGTDAAPYFRFNPTTQGERFDRDGEFIRQLPALRDIPGKAIHEPWRWAKAGVVLDYPRPIVEHKQARATLSAYEAARKGA